MKSKSNKYCSMILSMKKKKIENVKNFEMSKDKQYGIKNKWYVHILKILDSECYKIIDEQIKNVVYICTSEKPFEKEVIV